MSQIPQQNQVIYSQQSMFNNYIQEEEDWSGKQSKIQTRRQKQKNKQDKKKIDDKNNTKLTKRKFVQMIGGWKKFRDYLQNHKQLYIPPINDFNAEFGLQILQKKKKAFKNSEINFIQGVPQESEFKVEKIMEMIKNDEEVNSYLPNYSDKHNPDKSYICNILNTVHSNSILNWIKQVKEKKMDEKQKQKEQYILIDNQTLKDLEGFQSIYGAEDDKRNRLAGLMCESRKKSKQKRKKKFILEYVQNKFSELADKEQL